MANCIIFHLISVTSLRFLVYFSLALVCCSSCVHCGSHGSRIRGLFAKIFLGLRDHHFDSNFDAENVNIDPLINLNKIVFEGLLSDDLGDGLAEVKHRIRHRADTGPFRLEIDPNNAVLLNETAKKILAQMMILLSKTPAMSSTLPAEKIGSSVEKSCLKICQNGGACLVSNGTGACFCLTGFRGEFCEFLDDCNSAPGCGSAAYCVHDGGHRRCRCQNGFILSEKGCVADGQCREVTCQNGGTCLPLPFSAKLDSPKEFSCRCKLGFRGEFCEEVIPECDLNPCKSDEVCIATPTGSYCKSQKSETNCKACYVVKLTKFSNDDVIRRRHRSFKMTWMSLLWLLIPLATLLLAPFIIFKVNSCKRNRDLNAQNTNAKVRNNRLKDGKRWFQNRHSKDRLDNSQSDQQARQSLLPESDSEDDDEKIIKDGVGQIV